MRGRRLIILLVVIAAGLGLRRYGPGWGLTFPVVKYGGSLLWGTMVYFLIALLLSSTRRMKIVALSLLIAVSVEFFRLYHTPWLDAFRLTPAGALLVGRVFSLWNILAYAVGIFLGSMIDKILGVHQRKR